MAVLPEFRPTAPRLTGAARAAAGVALLLALTGCRAGPLDGRYHSETTRGEWLEFRRDGRVVHGVTGDAAAYRVDDRRVFITMPGGPVEGRLDGAATVRFGPSAGPFAGAWTASPAASAAPADDGQALAAQLTGQWRLPGETHVLDLRADGTYSWGPELSGTWQVLDASRIRRSVVQRGQTINPGLVEGVAIEGAMLRLTMPDGSVTAYERVP